MSRTNTGQRQDKIATNRAKITTRKLNTLLIDDITTMSSAQTKLWTRCAQLKAGDTMKNRALIGNPIGCFPLLQSHLPLSHSFF